MVTNTVLCHIVKDGKLLLQKKSKGLFGEGRWNAVGGKIGIKEKPEEAALREVLEEAGIKVLNLKEHGKLNFHFGNKSELDIVTYVFSTNDFEGRTKFSREGILKWFNPEEIPYDKMWQDDEHWLPLLLKGKKFQGEFHFDEEGKRLLDFNLKEML